MADAQKIDAARALVARIHDVVANVVDYDGNGFCWGWSTIGSAHPHALQHGAVVEVGHVDASVGVCATLNDMCLERWARRHVYDCRSHDRYSTLVNAASCANMAENNFYNHGNKKQPDVLRAGGFCGPISIAILADQLGIDYVAVFGARTGINNLPVLITTNRRDGDKQMEHQLPFDDVLERVQELRSQNRNAGAYVVHVPGH